MDPFITGSLISAGGGLLSGLFGGSENTAQPEPWKPAKPYIRDIMGLGQDLYGMGAMNPLQMMGLQNQLGFSSAFAPGMINSAMGGWGQMMNPWSQGPLADAWSGALDMSQGGINPYGEQLMADAAANMTQSFQEGILPQISMDAIGAGPGAFGNSRQAINESLATDRFLEDLGQSQNALGAELYRQGLGQQQAGVNALGSLGQTGYNTIGSAVSGLPGMLGAGMWPGQMMYDVGAIYHDAPWNQLNNYSSIIQPYGAIGTTQSQPNLASRIGGQMVGFGLQNMFSSMFPPSAYGTPTNNTFGQGD